MTSQAVGLRSVCFQYLLLLCRPELRLKTIAVLPARRFGYSPPWESRSAISGLWDAAVFRSKWKPVLAAVRQIVTMQS